MSKKDLANVAKKCTTSKKDSQDLPTLLTDTDDEDDEPTVLERRHARKERRRGDMKASAKGSDSNFVRDTFVSHSTEPYEMSDEEFIKYYYIRHCNITSKKWLQQNVTFPEKVRKEILKGGVLSGTDTAYQVSTGQDYANATDRLLGKIQALELQSAQELGDEFSSLVDGRIHYRNFFQFCQPQWIRPTNVLKLIQEEKSVQVMKHMMDGYRLLLEHSLDFVYRQEVQICSFQKLP